MTLNTPKQTTNSTLEEALSRVSLLSRLIPDLKKQLAEERANPPASQAAIEAEIAPTQIELDKLNAKLTKEKRAVKKRKKEIDEWKSWYNSNPHIDKSVARAKLDVEIAWRAQEIATHESMISALETAKLAIVGQLQHLNIQLQAFLEGCYQLPLEADPRLVEANAALSAAKAALRALQAASDSV